MHSVGKALVTLGTLALIPTLSAAIPERYQTIIDRNAFGLNPPTITAETNAPPAPPVTVKVSGFVKRGDEVRAYFVIPGKDAKDTQYLTLGEGEKEGIVEVLKISNEEGEVRIKNSGIDQVLSLDKNGMNPMKLAPGVTAAPTTPMPLPAPAVVPGQPGQPAQAAASPVYNPAASASVVAAGTYSPRGPAGAQNASGGVAPAGQPGAPQPGTVITPTGQPPQPGGTTPPAPEYRSIPTRTLRLPTVPQGNPQSAIPGGVPPVVFTPGNSTVVAANTYNPQPQPTPDPVVQKAVQDVIEASGGPPAPPFPPPGYKGPR